jgi:hypothetical protein
MYDIKKAGRDAWQGTLGAVGDVTGKALSKKQKAAARKARLKAADEEYDESTRDKRTPEEQEADLKAFRTRDDAKAQAKIDRKKKANRNWRDDYDFTKKDKKPQKTRRGERVHDREDEDPDLSGYSESIDRDKLARIIAEELQKVLKSR